MRVTNRPFIKCISKSAAVFFLLLAILNTVFPSFSATPFFDSALSDSQTDTNESDPQSDAKSDQLPVSSNSIVMNSYWSIRANSELASNADRFLEPAIRPPNA